MKVQLLSHYQYSQKIVSFLIILFAFSSCVSDEITTEMVHSPEPDEEQTDDPTPPENPAPAFSLQTSTGEDINLTIMKGK